MWDQKLHKLCIALSSPQLGLPYGWFQTYPNFVKFGGLVNGGTFDNLINMIFNSLLVYGGFIV
jgi:hypothetical protein